ncbi:tyrosine-protein phosphatase [Rhodococcus koreensis]|uniref:tyrosine-protein phosphatase n=1 Tax=Rhodococcus koreensis TaxID=99653 RepID=UPI0036D981BC
MRALACSPAPVLVHCTAGKDRTGLLVALALAAVGVPDAVIVDDYARSGTLVRPHREEAVRRLSTELALDSAEHAPALDLHLDSPPSVLAGALTHVRSRHGTVTNYLRAQGFTDTDLAALCTRLLDVQDTGTPAATVTGFDAPRYSIVRCSGHEVSALPIPLHTPTC